MTQHASTSTAAGIKRWKPLLLMGVILALFAAALTFDWGPRLQELRGWIEGLGVWGPLVFIAVYIVATVAMVPGTAMTALAGGLFGAVRGTLYVSLGATSGAAICFLIARYFARDTIARWLKGRPQFEKIDRLTQSHGAWIVAGLRLAPIVPFNVLNYGLGLTRVGFWTYLFWSWLCMIPGTIVYVVGADALVTGLREGRVPWRLVAVAVVGLLILLTLAWYAKAKLLPKREV